MIGKNIVAGSFDSMVAAFKSSNFSKQSSVSGDFSKTMSAVQDNQAKSAENKKSNTDFAKGMKKLTDSDKLAMDSDKRLEAKKNTKSLKETQDIDSENAVVLASSQIQASQLLEQGLGELEEKITELVTEIMGVTEKELMDLLEKSGMQLLDLLNPDNLKQFVLDANGCEDAVSLITNEEVATQFEQLLDAVDELESELGITKEELVDLTSENITKIVVEKDTGSKDMADNEFDRNQQSEADSNPVELFVQNLAAKSADGVNQTATEKVQVMREIVDQIVEKIKVAIKPGNTSMELQLNPESLGRVNLTVASKNGVLTASFTAENQISKEAIESQVQMLKDNLNNQGIKVEAIEVNVSQFGFRQNTESGADAQGQSKQQKKTGTRRINLDSFNEEAAEVSEEEALAARVLRDNGGSVDYTA